MRTPKTRTPKGGRWSAHRPPLGALPPGAPKVLLPPDVLGHLVHQLQPQRPEELRMVVREVALSSVEQFLMRIACELRPALAISDPPVTVVDRGDSPPIAATRSHLFLRPAENLCVCDPGFHGRAQCNAHVVDTFPDRCRCREPRVREHESSSAGGCP